MLVIMVWGLCSNLQYPLAAFTTEGITPGYLFPIVWEAIKFVQVVAELKVIFICCDGASSNRKFFTMHDNDRDKETYKTRNPVYKDHHIYFISDPPHLLKTICNYLSNSYAHKQSQHLWNQSTISWRDIQRLFQRPLYGRIQIMSEVDSSSYIPDIILHHEGEFGSTDHESDSYGSSGTEVWGSRACNCEIHLSGQSLVRHYEFTESERSQTDTKWACLAIHPCGWPPLHLAFERFPHIFRRVGRSCQCNIPSSLQTWSCCNETQPSDFACFADYHQIGRWMHLFYVGAWSRLCHDGKFQPGSLERHISHYRQKGGANENPSVFKVCHLINQVRVVSTQAVAPKRGNVRGDVLVQLDNTPVPRKKI